MTKAKEIVSLISLFTENESVTKELQGMNA